MDIIVYYKINVKNSIIILENLKNAEGWFNEKRII